MRFALLTIFAILFINNLGFGQSNLCQKKADGIDFWFGFMEGRHYDASNVYTEITVTSSHYCNYSIYIGKSKIPFVLPAPLDGTVKPNIPVQIRVPWQQVEAIGSEINEQKAIH